MWYLAKIWDRLPLKLKIRLMINIHLSRHDTFRLNSNNPMIKLSFDHVLTIKGKIPNWGKVPLGSRSWSNRWVKVELFRH